MGFLETSIQGDAIIGLTFVQEPSACKVTDMSPILCSVIACIQRYCAGDGGAFDLLPLHAEGTSFQQAVWKAAQRIPYGQTKTYGAIAREIGHPRSARAVGTALKGNPLAIAIPCHRVLPVSGGIGGFAWGKQRKKLLLTLESRQWKKSERH